MGICVGNPPVLLQDADCEPHTAKEARRDAEPPFFTPFH